MRKILLILSVITLQCVVAQNGGDLQLAQKYEQNGDIDKAISLYGEAFEKDPSPYVYEQYLRALLSAERYEQAEKTIKQFQKKSTNPLLVQIDLGYLELLKERAATAVAAKGKKKPPQLRSDKIFQTVIDDLPDKISSHVLQECSQALLLKTGSAKYSILLYQKARANGKNDMLYAEELGSLYRQNGQGSEMLNEFIKALKADERKLQQIEENIQVFISTNPQKKTGYLQNITATDTERTTEQICTNPLSVGVMARKTVCGGAETGGSIWQNI
jgi:tetratricopeptide (TPR) repeat protein